MSPPVKPVFVVVDCEFNRRNYPSLIGKEFTQPPGYATCTVNPAVNPYLQRKQPSLREMVLAEYCAQTGDVEPRADGPDHEAFKQRFNAWVDSKSGVEAIVKLA